MKFIHVIRDARDVMLSDNTHFLKDHGYWVLGNDWRRAAQAAQLQLWRLGNRRVVAFGERYLGNRYHTVRYESLPETCANSSGFLQFLGMPSVRCESTHRKYS
jgi:hypothetical protein